MLTKHCCALGTLALASCLLLWTADSQAGDKFKLEEGYTSLFNGKDFSGWYYIPKKGEKEDLEGKTATSDKRMEVADGVIVMNPGKGIKDVFTTKEYNKDLILKMQFRAAPKADSGVYLRAVASQLQVRDYPTVGPYKNLKKFKDQDWNDLEIVVKGTIATCTCNGELLTDKMKIPDKGGIGLQAEAGKFEFRHIRVKELP